MGDGTRASGGLPRRGYPAARPVTRHVGPFYYHGGRDRGSETARPSLCLEESGSSPSPKQGTLCSAAATHARRARSPQVQQQAHPWCAPRSAGVGRKHGGAGIAEEAHSLKQEGASVKQTSILFIFVQIPQNIHISRANIHTDRLSQTPATTQHTASRQPIAESETSRSRPVRAASMARHDWPRQRPQCLG